jgi:glycolate oxidase FAD binding subunit
MTADSIPAPLVAACSEVRLARPADCVAGVQPSYVACPASTEEAGVVLRAAASLGLAVLPRGTGTRIGWGAPPRRCDLVVEMTRMDRVLEHAAGDLVARVQAGVRLGQLASVLDAANQRLALDPPAAGTASAAGTAAAGATGAAGTGTVGGLVATGVTGPLRLRYGSPRDLLIGITVIRADGTVAKAGGRVVKNVAGYDIGKLFAGSYGTLGLITEAAFRLHPLPAASVYVTLDCADAAVADRVMSAAAQSPLAPSAAEIDWPGLDAPIRAGILLEGDPAGASERAARMRELLGDAAVSSDEQPPWWGQGAAAAAKGTVIRVAFWAGELPGVLSAVRAAAAAAGLDPAVSGSAAAGVIHAAVQEQAAPAAVAEFLLALRARLGQPMARAVPGQPATAAIPGQRASAVVLHAPPEVREVVDMWGPVSSLGLMQAVKDQFDPEHRMAPGRYVGGI